MADSAYDKIRKERCEWCAKGVPLAVGCEGQHSGGYEAPKCTAPTPEAFSDQQAAEIGRLKNEVHEWTKIVPRLAEENNSFRADIAALKKRVEELTRTVKIHVGKAALTKDLVWCDCGRGISLTGIWIYCPRCGGKIDQESYRTARVSAGANGGRSYRETEDVEAIADLTRQLAEERERLDWLIDTSNHAEKPWLSEDIWDELPGDSEDPRAEVRAFIDAARNSAKEQE